MRCGVAAATASISARASRHVPGHGEGQLAQPGVGDGGDDEDLDAARLEVGLDHLGQLERLGHVGLVEHDDAGALGQRAAAERRVGDVLRELGLDDVEVGHRVTARLEGRAVDDVDQHRAALDVAQELQAEALALAGAGDEAGDVGDGEALVAGLHDAEVGHERGERVVGDLGPRRRQHRHERGLARRREADERDVGERLELEHDVAGVAGLAEQGEAGRLAAGRGERLVAQPPAAAAGDDELGVGPTRSASTCAVAVLDDGARRGRAAPGAAVGAVALVTRAGLAVGGLAVGVVVVVEQGGGVAGRRAG